MTAGHSESNLASCPVLDKRLKQMHGCAPRGRHRRLIRLVCIVIVMLHYKKENSMGN